MILWYNYYVGVFRKVSCYFELSSEIKNYNTNLIQEYFTNCAQYNVYYVLLVLYKIAQN